MRAYGALFQCGEHRELVENGEEWIVLSGRIDNCEMKNVVLGRRIDNCEMKNVSLSIKRMHHIKKERISLVRSEAGKKSDKMGRADISKLLWR